MVARSTLRMALLYPNALAQVKIFLPSCRKGPNKRSSPVIRLGPNRHRHSCRAKTWHRASSLSKFSHDGPEQARERHIRRKLHSPPERAKAARQGGCSS